jgi:NADH-quinone oxidoreductase subunit N
MPPFSVFWGKLYLISTAVNSGFITLAVIMVLNSALAIYYYMKLIVYMFLKEPKSMDKSVYISNISTTIKIIVGFCVMVATTSVFMIEPLLKTILNYVTFSGY